MTRRGNRPVDVVISVRACLCVVSTNALGGHGHTLRGRVPDKEDTVTHAVAP